MSTQTTAFTAAGAGAAFSLQPGQSVTYSSSGTFTGYVRFQISRNQGASWETIQDAAVDTNLAGGTWKNETNAEQRFRFQVFDTDDLTPVTGTVTTVVADVNDLVAELKDNAGRVFAKVYDNNIQLVEPPTSPAGHFLDFSNETLPASTNAIRGASVNPTRASGWISFSGTVGATPAQVYSDYRELHTSGVAEVLGFGSFPYMDAGASCASMFAQQNIAYVSTGATVLTAGGAPGVGIFAVTGKVVIDGATFNAGGVAAAQFLSFQANVTDVQAEDTAMANWEVASGGIKQMIRFRCSGAKGATYFVNFDDNAEPAEKTVAKTTAVNDVVGNIKVLIGDQVGYINVHSAKAT